MTTAEAMNDICSLDSDRDDDDRLGIGANDDVQRSVQRKILCADAAVAGSRRKLAAPNIEWRRRRQFGRVHVSRDVDWCIQPKRILHERANGESGRRELPG